MHLSNRRKSDRFVEPLEGRVLFSATTITGIALDAPQLIRDPYNPQIGYYNYGIVPGLTVFDDLNDNGMVDDGEANTVTDSNGRYALSVSSSEDLKALPPNGWASVWKDMPVADPNTCNFGLVRYPVITGKVFEDINFDGVYEVGEPVQIGVKVFNDRPRPGEPPDAVEPWRTNDVLDDDEGWVITDGNAGYRFVQDFHGTANIRFVDLPGWERWPASRQQVLMYDGQYQIDTPIYRSRTITGVVFQDDNHNGVRDAGEGTLSGIRIAGARRLYSSNWGVDEWVGVKDQSGADGSFTLTGVPVLDPRVAIDSRGFVRTTTQDQSLPQLEIGLAPVPSGQYGVASVKGLVFDDRNRNNRRDKGERPLSGVNVESLIAISDGGFIDFTHLPHASAVSGAKGRFLLVGLPEGRFSISVGSTKLLVESDQRLFNLGALETKTVNIPVHLYCYMTGEVTLWISSTQRSNLDKARVYLDRNNNGKLDWNEPNTLTDNGMYEFDHVTEGRYTVRVDVKRLVAVRPLPHGVAHRGRSIQHPPIILKRTRAPSP